MADMMIQGMKRQGNVHEQSSDSRGDELDHTRRHHR